MVYAGAFFFIEVIMTENRSSSPEDYVKEKERFFLCAAECGGIIKVIFCISLKTVIERSAKQTKVCDAKLQGL